MLNVCVFEKEAAGLAEKREVILAGEEGLDAAAAYAYRALDGFAAFPADHFIGSRQWKAAIRRRVESRGEPTA